MTDGSEARQGDDSLGMEISEPLDMRSCPGYTNQELSSLPSHILLPKDAAGRQLVPREGAWPKRMVQISTQLLAHPEPKYTAFPPNEDPLMEQEIRTCIPPPSPPATHRVLSEVGDPVLFGWSGISVNILSFLLWCVCFTCQALQGRLISLIS